jgi:hypothetical protein
MYRQISCLYKFRLKCGISDLRSKIVHDSYTGDKMKKILTITTICFLVFTGNIFATPNLGGYEENMNRVCGPVYGGPNEDECTSDFELYVYNPLYVECLCEDVICIGWFTPGQTYFLPTGEQDILDRSCEFLVYGEYNLWIALTGTFFGSTPEVEMSDIQWEKNELNTWQTMFNLNTATGFFQSDDQLSEAGLQGPGWGQKIYRVYANTIDIDASAHGYYTFSATLEAHYNF